jgi:hypothetical protein
MLCKPLQVRMKLAIYVPVSRALRAAVSGLAGVSLLAAVSACEPPFGLGTPTTRGLENGAADTLAAAGSFEITGSYTESGQLWSIDLQLQRPSTEHVVVSNATEKVEAIIINTEAYFRGQKFLAERMGSDPISQNLVRVAGNAWWKGAIALAPQLPDLTVAAAFKVTLLGQAVTQRTDHVSVDGIDAVDLSGSRADIFIAAQAPYRVLRVRMKKGVAIDGMGEGDLKYTNFNHAFGIAAPSDVIDFSNLSTLPPIYSVVSVDTSGCGSVCQVRALIKNLGGMTGAKAPSTVTFTMTTTSSGAVLGSCQVQVVPDVGYNATETVGCTISMNGQVGSATIVTARPDNPGRA